jgi:hypothetical protein
MMRYHWGLGIGHYHAHQATSTSCHATNEPGVDQDEQISNMKLDSSLAGEISNVHPEDGGDELANDVLELILEDRHLAEEGWQYAETDSLSDNGHGGSESDPDWEDVVEDEYYTGL